MCGLVVFPSCSSNNLSVAERLVDTMQHRGFSETNGVVEHKGYVFGHTRLPIRGLNVRYDQPFRMGEEVGVFVGEVFNLPGWKNDAEGALHEVIHGGGPYAARHFDGFFSMAYTLGESLIVQTDHLGIKPLYFDEVHNVVASELKVIAAAYTQQFDPLYFSNVAKWGYDPSTRTPFKNVRRLAPGTLLEFRGDNLIDEFCYFPLKPRKGNLRTAIETSVERRLISDIPVGVLCSGGLDSTIVALLAAQYVSDLTVFHVENEEEEFAALVPLPKTAKRIYVPMHPIDPADAYDATETPVDLGSVVPQYGLAEALAELKFNVVLTGDGADELFGGYRRAAEYDSQYSDTFLELPAYHLPRLDAIMMRKTIELRSPYLSPEVIEIALGIPYDQRRHKECLKAAFKDIVPEEILNRRKQALKTKAVEYGGVHYRNAVLERFKRLWSEKYDVLEG